MKIGLLREEKKPFDKRVPFTPLQCSQLQQSINHLTFIVQPSPHRSYSDAEYLAQGIAMQEDLSECDVLMGIKEVPPPFLIEGKTYCFFSHTIKKQPHNQPLIKALLDKKITMVDYETLVDMEGNRVIGFGRYAGIVGAYNGIMGYGSMYNLFTLKPAHLSHDKQELFEGLQRVGIPNIKIIITGGGRVSHGAEETMGAMKIRKVTPYEFLNYSFREPVYTQLHSHDYHESKDGKPFSKFDFYNHPEEFHSTFIKYAGVCDVLIHCAYWDPKAPLLFSKKEMKDPGFHISVIADVTCDINGSIPSTMKASTIDDKFYGYDPMTETITEPFRSGTVTVMAIDNLPCELPRDASEGFGKHLMERVMPDLTGSHSTGLIDRATICRNGKLTKRFEYLKVYAGVQPDSDSL
ncbi:MAG TPA: NAD(P)-dependent oxidoreductase [Bacteroidia bacterium]|nr:NAD(P)-dependent oxidoreductase [Bacteroidia bacterium]